MEEDDRLSLVSLHRLEHEPPLQPDIIPSLQPDLLVRHLAEGWGPVPLWIATDILDRLVRHVQEPFLRHVNQDEQSEEKYIEEQDDLAEELEPRDRCIHLHHLNFQIVFFLLLLPISFFLF